jgi:hypothetical protein
MPCNLQTWDNEPWSDATTWFADFAGRQDRVHWFHGAKIVSTADKPDDDATLVLRFICHFLVDQIADQGLPEVCQSLREFHDYYEPVADAQQYLPRLTESGAIIDSSYTRPAFAIEGE